MTKIRMGRHNAVSAERFHLIRGAIGSGMSDQEVMRKYDIKRTTLNYIQKSKTYYEYQLYTEKLPAARKIGKVIAPKSGLAFEDIPLSLAECKQEKNRLHKHCEALEESIGFWGAIAGIVMFVIVIIGLTIIWR